MAGCGDDLFVEHDEAGQAVEELAEASGEDARANASSAAADVAEAAAAAIDDAHGRVGEGNGSASDGAARPSQAAAATSPAGSSGTASGSSASDLGGLTMKARIAALKEEQRRLRATNKAKTREIRNAERRSKRLKMKVGGLTDEDLNQVLRARAEAKAVAAKPAGGAGRATSGWGEPLVTPEAWSEDSRVRRWRLPSRS